MTYSVFITQVASGRNILPKHQEIGLGKREGDKRAWERKGREWKGEGKEENMKAGWKGGRKERREGEKEGGERKNSIPLLQTAVFRALPPTRSFFLIHPPLLYFILTVNS